MNPFLQNLRRVSPRYTRRAVPWQSNAIHFLVLASFILSIFQIFQSGHISKWSVGILYVFYDGALIVFTLLQIVKSDGAKNKAQTDLRPLTATVVVACCNEAKVIGKTISTIQAQLEPFDRIIIADDGSTDDLAQLLQNSFGVAVPDLNGRAARGNLTWLRLDHGGKSNALNQALENIETDLFITVDADTILHDGAVGAMKQAFSRESDLVAATGVLRPVCEKGIQGAFFQFFQKYEYMRNFLSRSAWDRIGVLLLLSGAFAGYRTQAVKQVGGFDNACIVEDYELTHRMMDYGFKNELGWRTSIVGRAGATTTAPGKLSVFMRQRRRWFGGFIQTQAAYRHMVGNPACGRIGTVMLPVKAVDALQPFFGLTGFLLLLYYALAANWLVLAPILILIACKLVLDLAAVTAFLFIFDGWAGGRMSRHILAAWLATLVEPFLFQPLRHSAAIWGWVEFLSRDLQWKKSG